MDAGEDQEGILGEGIDEGRAVPTRKMVYQLFTEEWDEEWGLTFLLELGVPVVCKAKVCQALTRA